MAELFSDFTIKIGGQKASEDLLDDVLEVVIDTNLHMPDMFMLQLYDDDLKWVDDPMFDVGKPIEISYDNTSLFKGELTNLEPNFNEEGRATLVVRGYDKSHRLHRGRKARTFTKERDSSIAQKIAGEAGLETDIDSTPITYDYLIQNNQTNMEFLATRAERIGYQLFVADGKLYFKKGSATLGTGPELVWGASLRSFRPRLVAGFQADKMIVRGWDPNTKKQIKGEATPSSTANQGGITKTGGATAKSAFGGAEAAVVNAPVETVDEAKALAQALCDDIRGKFVQAEGVCFGTPQVKAGYKIKISEVGQRFSGSYIVTAATHIYRNGRYETAFTVSGRTPNTLRHLLNSEAGAKESQGLINSVVVALVTNNKDDAGLGRIKVKFPWLVNPDGVEIDSTWVRMAPAMAGQGNKGIYTLPEVDDEVLIAFEHGDMRYPYMVGALWNKKDAPPENNATVVKDGKTNQWIIQSRSGHVINLDDTNGKEKITVIDKTGNNKITIDSKANSMTIEVQKDLTLKAGGKIDIQATGDLTLKGKNLALQGQMKGEMKANQVAINGNTKVDVKALAINLN